MIEKLYFFVVARFSCTVESITEGVFSYSDDMFSNFFGNTLPPSRQINQSDQPTVK